MMQGACIECCRKHAAQISNLTSLQQKLSFFAAASPSDLQVIADFDYTLTRFRTPSNLRMNECHDIIEHSAYMPEAFRSDFSNVWADQTRLRELGDWEPENWWHRVHALMVKYGLNREWVTLTVQDDEVSLRAGVADFVQDLKRTGIPLTIVSAGLPDVIRAILHKEGVGADGIVMFGNEMEFNEQGILSKFLEPVITSANKMHLGNNSK
jgi:phosphoserine phosphatase